MHCPHVFHYFPKYPWWTHEQEESGSLSCSFAFLGRVPNSSSKASFGRPLGGNGWCPDRCETELGPFTEAFFFESNFGSVYPCYVCHPLSFPSCLSDPFLLQIWSSAMPQIQYSEKYYDDIYEYRYFSPSLCLCMLRFLPVYSQMRVFCFISTITCWSLLCVSCFYEKQYHISIFSS